jgi:hypothetical protein
LNRGWCGGKNLLHPIAARDHAPRRLVSEHAHGGYIHAILCLRGRCFPYAEGALAEDPERRSADEMRLDVEGVVEVLTG